MPIAADHVTQIHDDGYQKTVAPNVGCIGDYEPLFSLDKIIELAEDQLKAFDEDIETYDETDKFRHKKEAIRQFKNRLENIKEKGDER